jgi:hypothetical protein
MGVGGAIVVAGIITGALALSQDATLRDLCGGDSTCPPSARPAGDDLQTLTITTDALLFGGLAVALAGLVLTLVLRESSGGETASIRCGTLGCSADFRGTF